MPPKLPYPMLSDTGIRQFLVESDRCYPPDAVELSIEQQREAYNQLCDHFRKARPDDIRTKDLFVANGNWNIPIRRYAPNTGRNLPIMLYLHGGGFVVGDLESHDDICAEIASKANVNVISINYRLAPEHPFPTPFDDCQQVLNRLPELADELDFDAAKIVVGGDSAGGNLAAALCLAARDTRLSGNLAPAISGQILIYPDLGGDIKKGSFLSQSNAPGLSTDDVAYYRKIYAGPPGHPNYKNKLTTPMLERHYTELPPAFLVAVGFDPLHDDCLHYAANLTRAGVPAKVRDEPLLVHSFLRARHMSEAAAASFDAICTAIHRLAYDGILPDSV